jgi:hypothetical protein
MSIEVSNIKTTKVHIHCCAPDSAVHFFNFFHVFYDEPIEAAMKTETVMYS